MAKKIVITQNDSEKLRKFIKAARQGASANAAHIQRLVEEIESAEIVDREQIGADVITMNTEAVVKDVKTGETETYKVVFPEYADIDTGKVSVLSPLGCALLGYRINDEIEVDAPGGKRIVRVEKVVYQPEAQGNFEE